jgi:hypothetical protein
MGPTGAADRKRTRIRALIGVRRLSLERLEDGRRNSSNSVRRRSPERRVKLTDQFSDPPTAARGDRVAPQDVHHDGMRSDPRLRDVSGSDDGIVSGGEFERSCGKSGRSQDVLDLSSFCKRVEERRTHRGAGRARSVACRSLSRIAGLPSRPVCRPGAIT